MWDWFEPSDYVGSGGETGGSPDSLMPTVGPQSDGTVAAPQAAQPNNQPWGVGGTSFGNYTGQVLDVLKFGVGVWQQNDARNDFYDYKRFEATNGGLFRQGAYAGYAQTPLSNRGITLAALILGGLLLVKLAD